MSAVDAAAPRRRPETRGRDRAAAAVASLRTSRYVAVLVLLVGLFAFFAATESAFLRSGNLDNLLTSVSILFLVSIALTFTMLSGGFDLSLGSTLALSGVFLGKIYADGAMPAWAAALLTVAFGATVAGVVNGVGIGRLGLPFLVVTLGSLALFRGVTNVWSDGRTTPLVSSFFDELAFGKLLGLPIPVWLMAAVYVGALFVSRRTYFGRDIYAVGGNPQAARLAGLGVASTLVAVYALAGGLAAMGGVLQAARVGAASPVVGETIVFDAAAAVLLGGTVLGGGVGGVTGTVFGVLFLGVLQNGLAVSGVQSFWQQVVAGAILILVVAVDRGRAQGWWRARGRAPAG